MRGGWVGGWCLVWRLPRSALCSRNASCLGYHTVQRRNGDKRHDLSYRNQRKLVTTQTSTSTLTREYEPLSMAEAQMGPACLATWPARKQAGRMTSACRREHNPTPYFTYGQRVLCRPHRATAVDRHSVRDPFFLPVRERVTSLPLPCAPHVGAGLPADRRFAGPFHLGTPPCPLGVSCPGGPKSCPPVSTIIPRTCIL